MKETVTNIEDGTNGNLPHSEKKSRVLLSKVPCCRHGSAAKKAHTSHRHTLNTTSNRLTAGNFLDTNTNLTSLSAQSSVSMVTEVSVVGFTSPGSIERLTETHVPRRHTGHSVSKTGRFAIFRRNREKLTNSCIHQVEVCQINIEECSDKCDVGRENVTCEYTSPESAAQLARPAEIRPRISSQTFNHCYNQRDSSDDDSDDCLLNERQADKASFELKPMVPRKIDIDQNDSFSREHNQCISLVRKPTEQRHLDREKDKTDDILDKGNYPQEQFVLTTDL